MKRRAAERWPASISSKSASRPARRWSVSTSRPAALLAFAGRLELVMGAIVCVGDAAGVELGKIALEALQEAPARSPGPGVAAGF